MSNEGVWLRTTYSGLMQSKYFSPAFNSAIFDGPLRIYFAQFHESLALKIYFLAQQKLKAELLDFKERAKVEGGNVLVMVYLSEETILMSFESAPIGLKIVSEQWSSDQVIGLRGALEDHELDLLILEIQQTISNWPSSHEMDLEQSLLSL